MQRVIGLLIAGVISFVGMLVWSEALRQALDHGQMLRRAVAVEGHLDALGLPQASNVPVRAHYSYTVGGVRYEGGAFRLGETVGLLGHALPNARLDRADAADVAHRFTPGPVTVFHDPDAPERAFLDRHRPAAPLVLMSLSGLVVALMGMWAMHLLTHHPQRPKRIDATWVRLAPTVSLHSRAMTLLAGAALLLLLVVPAAAYCAAIQRFWGTGFWAPIITLLITTVIVASAVYFTWQWRRVASAQLLIGLDTPSAGVTPPSLSIPRGQPFRVRLRLTSPTALITGGKIELAHQELVTRRTGKNRSTTWVDQSVWTTDVPPPIGPERTIDATGTFTLPTDQPGTERRHRYVLRPRIRLAFGPDYGQDFGLPVS